MSKQKKYYNIFLIEKHFTPRYQIYMVKVLSVVSIKGLNFIT
jgi:hypothetical protein